VIKKATVKKAGEVLINSGLAFVIASLIHPFVEGSINLKLFTIGSLVSLLLIALGLIIFNAGVEDDG